MALAIDPRTLDYVALGVFVTVSIFLIYLIIYIHDIPYEIAKKRNHPHQDAIHVAGWVSLFLMHVIWPFLWIWAYLYKPEQGWGLESVEVKLPKDDIEEFKELKDKITLLEQKLDSIATKEEAN